MICQLSKKSGCKWVVVKPDSSYHEAEEFALNQSGAFVVKMTGKDEDGNDETGYFTNCKDTHRHYQDKGLNSYLITEN